MRAKKNYVFCGLWCLTWIEALLGSKDLSCDDHVDCLKE
jgi:hypothetical protein